jgi:hypothetical protein
MNKSVNFTDLKNIIYGNDIYTIKKRGMHNCNPPNSNVVILATNNKTNLRINNQFKKRFFLFVD